MPEENLRKIVKPILWVSFFIGLVLSWSVLSGDSFGRVNLLYLIILYVIFPCFSLIYSMMSYFYSPLQACSLPSLVSSFIQNNNFLFTKYKQSFLKLAQNNSPKLTLLYLSQVAAIGFSLASLLVLFSLLVTTDVHFIWRSTLLSAEQILVFLKIISLPWQFWNDAQPTLDLISISQDNRLFKGMPVQSTLVNSNWWQFVLATQLFYAFLMRFIVLVFLNLFFKFSKQKRTSLVYREINISDKNNTIKEQPKEIFESDVKINFAINNWANFHTNILKHVESTLSGECINELNAGPEASDVERLIAERWRETQVIVVKSWEPPLAELSDYMENSIGYILPLDIKSDNFVSIQERHLEEWRRFLKPLPQWKIIRLSALDGEAVNQFPKERL